jgi:hypothetical protein
VIKVGVEKVQCQLFEDPGPGVYVRYCIFCEKSDIVFDCIKRGCVVWFQLKHLKASTTAYVTILKNYRLNSGG